MHTSASSPSLHAGPGWPYLIGWLLLGGALLVAAHPIGMINQGDYARAIQSFLAYTPDPTGWYGLPQGTRWAFLDEPGLPPLQAGASAFLFAGAAWVQRLFADQYDILITGLAARIGLLIAAERLGRQVALVLGRGLGVRFAAGAAFALTFFAAHNVAFTNALFMEFAFVLFLPVLVLGLFGLHTWSGRVAVMVGAMVCATAKAQFFYLPVLLGVVLLWVALRSRTRPEWMVLAGLAVIQVLALMPLAQSQWTHVNYYHATQLGSRLAMTPEQRLATDPTGRFEHCLGVDAWGNRLSRLDDVAPQPGFQSCLGDVELGVRDILWPYLRHPTLLPRLWAGSVPAHFTVDYFHVVREARYIHPVEGSSFGAGQPLVALSSLRDRLMGPWLALALVAAGVLAGATGLGRAPPPLATVLFFLAALAASQLAVSLVGEGVRDLSRHWAGAQFSLDLLVLCLGAWALAAVLPRGRSAQAFCPAGSAS